MIQFSLFHMDDDEAVLSPGGGGVPSSREDTAHADRPEYTRDPSSHTVNSSRWKPQEKDQDQKPSAPEWKCGHDSCFQMEGRRHFISGGFTVVSFRFQEKPRA